MAPDDKQGFINAVNSIMEVYGKAKLTPGAAQVWWDCLKEFDQSSVFTSVNYWPQYNTKPPAPADVWKQCNDKRSEKLEVKAENDRLVNQERSLPPGYGPTKEGKAFFRVVARWMKNKTKPIHHHMLDAHDEGETLHETVVAWARSQ